MPKINLIIADDHHLIRLGLKTVLAAKPNLELLNEFDNGTDALNYILVNKIKNELTFISFITLRIQNIILVDPHLLQHR